MGKNLRKRLASGNVYIVSCITTEAIRPATLLKRNLWHRCFLVNFAKFLRTPFFYRTHPATASVEINQYEANDTLILKAVN